MSYPVCHSGLDPESSFFLDSRFRGKVYACETESPFAAINVAVSQSKKVALIV